MTLVKQFLSAEKYFSLPGSSGHYLSLADSDDWNVGAADDLDIRFKVAATDWTGAVGIIVAHWVQSGSQRSFRIRRETAGQIRFSQSTNGSTTESHDLTPDSAFSGTVVGRVVRDAGTGVVTLYVSSDEGVTWDAQADTETATTGALFDSTGVLEIGSQDVGTGSRFNGRIYWVQLIIGGTTVLDTRARDYSSGSTLIDHASGKTVTINGANTFVHEEPLDYSSVLMGRNEDLVTTGSGLVTLGSKLLNEQAGTKSLARNTVGLKLVYIANDATNPFSTDDWTASTGASFSLSSGNLHFTPSGGTAWRVGECTSAESRLKRMIYTKMSNTRTLFISAIGVADASAADFFGGSVKTDDVTSSLVIREINNASNNALLIDDAADHNINTFYEHTTTIEDDGAGGMRCNHYSFHTDLAIGPQDSSVMGAAAKLGVAANEGNGTEDADYSEIWDYSDFNITVNGLSGGQKAKVLDSGDTVLATATESGGTATINCFTAQYSVPNGIHLVVTDSSDVELDRLTPSADATFGIAGVFPGDTYTYG